MKYQTAKYFLVFFTKRKKNVLDVCRMIFEEHGSVILWTVCGRRSFCVNRIDKVGDRLRSIDRFGFNYLLSLSFALNTKMVNLHKGALNPKQTMNMHFPLMLCQESFFDISI